ncbi:hypothetical protein EYC98_05785 [Halieaceae bacterium IMCC14734]|uniref:Polysaccharide deacetylase n=1 Tax=Candidatus Litorirhabdus singularis TaxID=2518993 RepID=A0ABT3TDK2_9GAMM|nr:hypothetical protein [Candidatus Litorirhabdus singularis]MCX2980381.1 hypothetical protein [Candidatus Litorirhabdus singularis]
MSGRFIISLDFELMWGMRDSQRSGDYRPNIVGAHQAIPCLLQLFERYKIAATWATVGLLLAQNKTEMQAAIASASEATEGQDPHHHALVSYVARQVGDDARNDPLHFGGDLVQQIISVERQELASHTLSHYCCLEPGASAAGFVGDMTAAITLFAQRNLNARSLVFARNQLAEEHLAALPALGIYNFRGNPSHPLYRERPSGTLNRGIRALRLADSLLPLTGPADANDEPAATPLNLPGSRFLRPWSPSWAAIYPLHLRRIRREMTAAARQNSDYHLWWHPHNFGLHRQRQLHNLEQLLQHQRSLSEHYGWHSANMQECGEAVQQPAVSPG